MVLGPGLGDAPRNVETHRFKERGGKGTKEGKGDGGLPWAGWHQCLVLSEQTVQPDWHPCNEVRSVLLGLFQGD